MNKVSINGVEVYPFTSDKELLAHIDAHKRILVAVNAEKILHATNLTREIINQNCGYCDGIGAVVALRKKGYQNVIKIAGCELWLKIIAMTWQQGKSYYLVGGTQAVIEQTVRQLKQDFPNIIIANYRNGYIKTQAEKELLLKDIEELRPDIIFVAMGSPKQELLMAEMAARHDAIYQGLGGSFDVYTGKVSRAPEWWRKHQLEGLYRSLAGFKWSKMKRLFKAMPFWWNVLTNKY